MIKKSFLFHIYCILLSLLLNNSSLYSRQHSVFRFEESDQNAGYRIEVTSLPAFEGGTIQNFRQWIYRQYLESNSFTSPEFQGTVLFDFEIDEFGRLDKPVVLEWRSNFYDDRLIDILTRSPRWEPARQGDRQIRVKCTLAVDFPVKKSSLENIGTPLPSGEMRVRKQGDVPLFRLDSLTEFSEYYVELTDLPRFRGGYAEEFVRWVRMEAMDREVLKKGIGPVVVPLDFEIDEYGRLCDPVLTEKIPGLNESVLLGIIGRSPEWESGRRWERAVRVKCSVTVPLPPEASADRPALFRPEGLENYRRIMGSDRPVGGEAAEAGKIRITFQITPDGKVVKVKVDKRADKAWLNRIARQLESASDWDIPENITGPVVCTLEMKVPPMARSAVPVEDSITEEKSMEAFRRWLDNNVRVVYQRNRAIKGSVTATFTVREDGRTADVSIVDLTDERLSEEAVRLLLSSPQWLPGIREGKYTESTRTVTVEFW